MIYVFDGSLEGLLCAIFERFERKADQVILKTAQLYQPDVFSDVLHVHNDQAKAERVWKALLNKLPKDWVRKFYCTFLSESADAYSSLFEFACYIFLNPAGAARNYGNEHILAVSKTAVKVEREKHRMEAFIRFQHLSDGVFYCGIDPDFNVLPLIIKHFRDRYADQKWIIYDIKRHYGIFYDLEKTEEIFIDTTQGKTLANQAESRLSEPEALYATLWKDYFHSTNIESRKNTKLHVKHVPKRYWKYLTEKQDSVRL